MSDIVSSVAEAVAGRTPDYYSFTVSGGIKGTGIFSGGATVTVNAHNGNIWVTPLEFGTGASVSLNPITGALTLGYINKETVSETRGDLTDRFCSGYSQTTVAGSIVSVGTAVSGGLDIPIAQRDTASVVVISNSILQAGTSGGNGYLVGEIQTHVADSIDNAVMYGENLNLPADPNFTRLNIPDMLSNVMNSALDLFNNTNYSPIDDPFYNPPDGTPPGTPPSSPASPDIPFPDGPVPNPDEPPMVPPPDPFDPPGGPWGGADGLPSPIILDLDGDGIHTVARQRNVAYFDLDTNGFAENTGWVGNGDGLLVLDRNNDGVINSGVELFGDYTLLQDGTRAQDGFQALAEFDDNQDGQIDGNDSVFAQLKIWQDFNGDGYSTPNELFGLGQLNVSSLSLCNTETNIVDAANNIEMLAGNFTRTDGTTAQMSDYLFATDSIHTVATNWQDVGNDVMQLPYLQGFGNTYDLWQAISRDQSGELQGLVDAFVTESNPTNRSSLMDQIIYRWTGSDTVDPASRGAYIDARQLTALERLFGCDFAQAGSPNPGATATDILDGVYRDVKEYYYVRLMAQSHCGNLLNELQFSWDSTNNRVVSDFTNIQNIIDADLRSDFDQGVVALSEFSRMVKGLGLATSLIDFSRFRNYYAEQSIVLARVIDLAGRNTVYGTNNADFLRGDSQDNVIIGGAGIDTLRGDGGYDFLYGGADNDVIYGASGPGLLAGGGGNDSLFGGTGSEILSGGIGDDYLAGDTGNDIYLWEAGFGNDTIYDYSGEQDSVRFVNGITADALEYLVVNNCDLVLKNKNTSETLTIANWFSGTSNQIGQFRFADGAVYTGQQIDAMAIYCGTTGNDDMNGYLLNSRNNWIVGLAGNDIIHGGNGNDTLDGGADNDELYSAAGDDVLVGGDGNDELYGSAGNDTLAGGTGVDYLSGDVGSDTYLWGAGSGNDTILDYSANINEQDTLRFTGSLTADSLDYWVSSRDLVLRYKTTGETLTIVNWFSGTNYQVEQFLFTDGAVYTGRQIDDMSAYYGTIGNDVINCCLLNNRNNRLVGLDGNDGLYGGSGSDTLDGGAGSDSLYGGAGNDILVGGTYNDYLNGSAGSDSYIWGIGSGNDTIADYSSNNSEQDIVQFTGGITADSLEYLVVNYYDLALKNKTTGETLTVANWFLGTNYLVEQFRFTDGIGYSGRQIDDMAAYYGTAGSDNITSVLNSRNNRLYGLNGNDRLSGSNGNDTFDGGVGSDSLYGGAGNDVLDGGIGNDYLYGDTGSDTYIWETSSGNDTIYNYDLSSLQDILNFQGLNQANLEFATDNNDLVFRNTQTQESARILKWLQGESYKVDGFAFSDGTTLTAADLNQRISIMQNAALSGYAPLAVDQFNVFIQNHQNPT